MAHEGHLIIDFTLDSKVLGSTCCYYYLVIQLCRICGCYINKKEESEKHFVYGIWQNWPTVVHLGLCLVMKVSTDVVWKLLTTVKENADTLQP